MNDPPFFVTLEEKISTVKEIKVGYTHEYVTTLRIQC